MLLLLLPTPFPIHRAKPSSVQVWKAEEGDLDSPRLQSQRHTLPALQQDPLQLQLKMDTFVIEVTPDAPLVEVRSASQPLSINQSTKQSQVFLAGSLRKQVYPGAQREHHQTIQEG